jgi:hypothetical protein
MLGGMLVFGGIATAHMPAGETQPQVHPAVAYFLALLATVGFGANGLDFWAMYTSCHGLYLSRRTGHRNTHLKFRIAWNGGEGNRAVQLADDSSYRI